MLSLKWSIKFIILDPPTHAPHKALTSLWVFMMSRAPVEEAACVVKLTVILRGKKPAMRPQNNVCLVIVWRADQLPTGSVFTVTGCGEGEDFTNIEQHNDSLCLCLWLKFFLDAKN